MLKTLKRLNKEKLIHPPKWMIDNTHYLCQMGSIAYGCNTNDSDIDVYGYCMPLKEMVFPFACGYIHDFEEPPRFKGWQQHHINDPSNNNEYDFDIKGIVKFFRLVLDGNPNMVDALFIPDRCVLHSTNLSNHVRDNKHLFLHKGYWKKFRGYSFSQLHKIETKQPTKGSKRYDIVQKYGYDTKFSYHVFRLMLEIEQILSEHTLELDKNGALLRSVREGNFTLKEIHDWFETKNKSLEITFSKSTLPETPKFKEVKSLLYECLEMHFGSISNLIKNQSDNDHIINQIKTLVL